MHRVLVLVFLALVPTLALGGEQSAGHPIAGDPGQLRACLTACASGPTAIQQFCRSLPDPKLRALCWAVVYAGEVACSGFCYARFGG